ncbi:7-cyano-7-deazaguanine synthase [Chloroflexota bacterium]
MNKAILVDQLTPNLRDTLQFKPGVNINTGEEKLRRIIGASLTSLELDLLRVTSAIFATDLAFLRGEGEEITRTIELEIPVVNCALFDRLKEDITFILWHLSHDNWKLTFSQKAGIPESDQPQAPETNDKILLFSGGLDSFSAALQKGYAGESLILVSHITANQIISGAQNELGNYLSAKFPGQFTRYAIRVNPIDKTRNGFPFPKIREDSQRTRTFLFITLAAILARRKGIRNIIFLAENGQLALNVPLTAARISAFTTHTAHPTFLYRMGQFISSTLNYGITIENPFLYQTKAEIVRPIVQHHEENSIGFSVSCWMSSHMRGTTNHCGRCIPCIIRRIANEYNNVFIAEYTVDLFNENILELDETDTGRRNLCELAEFIKFFGQFRNVAEVVYTYPELNNPLFNTQQAVDMYMRFTREANIVFNNYPNLRTFLQ